MTGPFKELCDKYWEINNSKFGNLKENMKNIFRLEIILILLMHVKETYKKKFRD